MIYKLRTLLIVLALGPLLLAAGWRWRQARQEAAVKAAIERYKVPCRP